MKKHRNEARKRLPLLKKAGRIVRRVAVRPSVRGDLWQASGAEADSRPCSCPGGVKGCRFRRRAQHGKILEQLADVLYMKERAAAVLHQGERRPWGREQPARAGRCDVDDYKIAPSARARRG